MILPEVILDFTGGIANDLRVAVGNMAGMVTNFDIFTNTRRIDPYYDSVDGDSDATNNQKQNFCIALRIGTTYSLFGLGVATGQAYARVEFKDLTTGASHDLDDNAWNETGNNLDSSGAVSFNLFTYYKKTGLIYLAVAGNAIKTYDPTGGAAWNNAGGTSISYTNIAEGLVHSKDDILYIGYDNKIASNNNGTWTTSALILPTNVYVTALAEYQDFLAIAVAPLSGIGKSWVYLWDRNSSLTTISQSIDWGEGILKVIGNIEGNLVGISILNDSTRTTNLIVFRAYNGITAKQFSKFVSTSAAMKLRQGNQKINNRLYFMMNLTLNGATREGVWSIGLSSSKTLAIAHERTPNNDTALGNGLLKAFLLVGDYMFISYVNNAGSYVVSKTNDQPSYTATSIYETVIFNTIPGLRNRKIPDSAVTKKLVGITLSFDPLPSGGTAALKYKKDNETTWTQIFKYASTGSISHSAVNLENLTAGGDTVTMTIASPAVVTLTNHGLVAGQIITFSTTGALPTGVIAGTPYYVISAGLTANTFEFSATSGGSAINTSGSQSGVHTMDRTVTLPEYKEIQFRIESTGGAVITALKLAHDTEDKDVYNAY